MSPNSHTSKKYVVLLGFLVTCAVGGALLVSHLLRDREGSEARVSQGPAARASGDQRQHKKDLKRLESAYAAADDTALRELAETLDRDWRTRDLRLHALLARRTYQLLLERAGDVNRQVARKSASSVIERCAPAKGVPSDVIPAEVLADLLLITYETNAAHWKSLAKTTSLSFKEIRRRRVRTWLLTLKRLEAGADVDLSMAHAPLSHVDPPPSVRRGTPPESVQDPAVRAAYEAAIMKNRKKAEEYSRRLKLKATWESFSPWAEKYIIAAYILKPSDLQELEGLLHEYDINEATAAKIRAGVRKR